MALVTPEDQGMLPQEGWRHQAAAVSVQSSTHKQLWTRTHSSHQP